MSNEKQKAILDHLAKFIDVYDINYHEFLQSSQNMEYTQTNAGINQISTI